MRRFHNCLLTSLLFLPSILKAQPVPFFNRQAKSDQDLGAINQNLKDLADRDINRTTTAITPQSCPSSQWLSGASYNKFGRTFGGICYSTTAVVSASNILTSTGGVVSGILSIKGPDPFTDVKAFGAKADCITPVDDTNAIQTAINSCDLRKGFRCRIYFPPGCYYTTGTIKTSSISYITIEGAGRFNTYIWNVGSSNGALELDGGVAPDGTDISNDGGVTLRDFAVGSTSGPAVYMYRQNNAVLNRLFLFEAGAGSANLHINGGAQNQYDDIITDAGNTNFANDLINDYFPPSIAPLTLGNNAIRIDSTDNPPVSTGEHIFNNIRSGDQYTQDAIAVIATTSTFSMNEITFDNSSIKGKLGYACWKLESVNTQITNSRCEPQTGSPYDAIYILGNINAESTYISNFESDAKGRLHISSQAQPGAILEVVNSIFYQLVVDSAPDTVLGWGNYFQTGPTTIPRPGTNWQWAGSVNAGTQQIENLSQLCIGDTCKGSAGLYVNASVGISTTTSGGGKFAVHTGTDANIVEFFGANGRSGIQSISDDTSKLTNFTLRASSFSVLVGTGTAPIAVAALTVVGGSVAVHQNDGYSPSATLDVNGTILNNSSITASSFFGDGNNLTRLSAPNLIGAVPNADVDLSTVTNVKASTGTCTLPNLLISVSSLNVSCQQPSNITGNAATVTTDANLTGPVTSVGNATSIPGPVPNGSVDLSTVTTALNTKASTGTCPSGQFISGAAAASITCAADNAGTITGSGTTNYVSKFTGATAIGNSLVYDNGSKVGINTSSPAQLLDVEGNVQFGSSASGFVCWDNSKLYLNVGNNTCSENLGAGQGQIVFISTTATATWPVVSILDSSAGIILTAVQNDRVGIGTASPATMLDVNGSATLEKGTAGNILCYAAGGKIGHCTAAAACTTTCTCTCAGD